MTCQTCDGVGAVATRHDPCTPYDECPDCVSERHCPRCGSFIANHRQSCDACEWRWDDYEIYDTLYEAPNDELRMATARMAEVMQGGTKIG